MEFNIERYNDYYNTLVGKQWADQYKKIFEGQRDYNEKYIINELENEKYWIIVATKNLFGLTERSVGRVVERKPDPTDPTGRRMVANILDWGTYKEVKYQRSSFLTSLYLHKEKDLVILKTSVVRYAGAAFNREYNDNSASYLLRQIRGLGYKKIEFTDEKGVIYGYGSSDLCYTNLKIMIPTEKTSDELIRLLNGIDQFNDFMMFKSKAYWDNTKDISKQVNIEF